MSATAPIVKQGTKGQNKSWLGKLVGSVVGYALGGPWGSGVGSTILGNVFKRGGKVGMPQRVSKMKKGGKVKMKKGSAEAKAYMASIRKMRK